MPANPLVRKQDYLFEMNDFPQDFEKRVCADSFLGQELLTALNLEPPTAIRLHPQKSTSKFDACKPIPWSPKGKWLNERPVFTLDPAFHGGAYYPQEAGSQLLASVLTQLNLPEQPVFLDLCAAPGGKSSLIVDFLNGNGFLVSNEIIANRAKILKENLTKWGAFNQVVTNNSPENIQESNLLFDCMVIDAPCSGEGMFRKDLQARNEWSEANVVMCANRQQTILETVWDNLKPGGYLIYSTCTFNENENEQTARWLTENFNAQIVAIQLPDALPGREGIGHYAMPHLLDTEGFFIVVFQKNASDQIQRGFKKKFKSQLSVVSETKQWEKYADLKGKVVIQWQNFQFMIPEQFQDFVLQLHHELRVIKLGTELGEVTAKDVVPNIGLALDQQHTNKSLHPIALNENEALKYLKGETFHLDGQKGYQLVSYQGVHVGWIKHLGNRFNNLYPKEWRIRMRID